MSKERFFILTIVVTTVLSVATAIAQIASPTSSPALRKGTFSPIPTISPTPKTTPRTLLTPTPQQTIPQQSQPIPPHGTGY